MRCCLNKATPIHFIDGKCHIKQLKVGKSSKTCLTNHTQSVSHHITSLVINSLGVEHMDTHTKARTKKPGAHQPQVCVCLVLKYLQNAILDHVTRMTHVNYLLVD